MQAICLQCYKNENIRFYKLSAWENSFAFRQNMKTTVCSYAVCNFQSVRILSACQVEDDQFLRRVYGVEVEYWKPNEEDDGE